MLTNSVKSWYVTLDSNVYASNEIFVNPGDQVKGIMMNVGPQQWFIESLNPQGNSRKIFHFACSCSFPGVSTNLTVTDEEGLASQPWAYNTLECYGCNSCDNEPTGAVHFTSLVIKDLRGRVCLR